MGRKSSIVTVCAILLQFCVFGCTRQPHQQIVINEAARTLLYLPLYHAQERGFFRESGLDVEIVTGGTATNSFAAMISGHADFSQADPMYVPISRQQGGQTRVVAQVVGRIALWAVTFRDDVKSIDARSLQNRTISTHIRPMTAFTYTEKMVSSFGLRPDVDVSILQSQPGSELVPLFDKKADYALTIEPQVSIAVARGAHVVFSYPEQLGDQIFTGLLTTDDFIAKHPDVVRRVARAYQKALDEIRSSPALALESAKKYFPQVEPSILSAALNRMISEQVIPSSVRIQQQSWEKAIAVRVESGDLKKPVPAMSECVWQQF